MSENWPSKLPQPEQTNYSHDYQPGTVRTEMESGPARIRLIYKNKPEIINISLLVTDNQKSIFDYFYYTILENATKWFTISLKRDYRNQNFDARFLGSPNAKLISQVIWQISGELEIKHKGLITQTVYQSLIQ